MKFNAKILITLVFLLCGAVVVTTFLLGGSDKHTLSSQVNTINNVPTSKIFFYNYSPKEIKINGSDIEVVSLKREDGLEYTYKFDGSEDNTLISLPYLSLGRYEVNYLASGKSSQFLFNVGLQGKPLDENCLEDIGSDTSFTFFRKYVGECVFNIVESKSSAKESLAFFQQFFSTLNSNGVYRSDQLMICQQLSEILGESVAAIHGFKSAIAEGVRYNYCELGQHYLRGVFSSVTSSEEDLDKYFYQCLTLFDRERGVICGAGFYKFLSNQYLYDIEKVLVHCKGKLLSEFFEDSESCIFVMYNSYLEDMNNYNLLSGWEVVEGTSKFAQISNLFKKGEIYKSCELLAITNSLACFQSSLFMTLGVHPLLDNANDLEGAAREILKEYVSWCNKVGNPQLCKNAVDFSLGKLVYLFPEEKFRDYCNEFSGEPSNCFVETSKYRELYKASIS